MEMFILLFKSASTSFFFVLPKTPKKQKNDKKINQIFPLISQGRGVI